MGFNDIDCGASCTVVVQRSGALGDVIWTTPLFKYMRDVAGFTGSIIVATQHPEVFANNPYVTDTISPAYVRALGGQCKVFDLDWSYESNRKKHILEAYCETLGIDFALVEKTPMLFPTIADFQWAHEQLVASTLAGCTRSVVIHAAATSPDRVWSPLRWEHLATWLIGSGFFVICVGACQDYHIHTNRRVSDLVGCTTIGKLIALIASADAFVGIDSGVSNIAFATNTPSLVLYGMAVPGTRLPAGSHVHAGITASASTCGCLGCLEHLAVMAPPLCHSFQRSQCMDAISVSAVEGAFTALRSNQSAYP